MLPLSPCEELKRRARAGRFLKVGWSYILFVILLALLGGEAIAQSPSAIYTWSGTGDVRAWFKNFGTNTVTLGNSTAGELTVTETGTAGEDVAISDGANRIRETPSAGSPGLDLTGLDYLEFDIGHNGADPIDVGFFVQASTGFTFVALGPDVSVTPGVNTYQVPLTGLTPDQLVYIRTIGFWTRDHVALGNVTWTVREVRSGGTPLTERDLITHNNGTPEGGLQGAIVNFDNAAVLGNNGGQNQTGLAHNSAGTGSLQWTDVGGQNGAALSWGNGTAWNGNTSNMRETDLSNYATMIVRMSAAETTPGSGSVNVSAFFQTNNFAFQSVEGGATRTLSTDGEFHDLVWSLAGLTNMEVVDLTGIDLASHAGDLLIDVDSIRFIPAPSHLANISGRALVGTGENVEIGGFIIHDDQAIVRRTAPQPQGPGPPPLTKSVIIRGLGPSLNITGQLEDPVLELRAGNGTFITSNDDWGDALNATDITNSGLAPTDADEAAILITLNSESNYTAILRGKDDTTGVGLVEIYDLEPSAAAHLVNLSTRAFVSTGADVLIGGVIVGGGRFADLMFRAIGPSMASQGVANALQDPQLDIHDVNGTLLSHNDDWQEEPDGTLNPTRTGDITATGLAPTNLSEAAIHSLLPPGLYTAIVSGVGNTTGIGLVEVYFLGSAPNPAETCNGLDDDADGQIDEDPIDGTTWYEDSDGDTFGNPTSTVVACDQPSGYVADNSDCDDGDASVYPGALEFCDEKDNDCDGQIDEDPIDGTTWYRDSDGDGYGDATNTVEACDQPVGYTNDNTDCDDNDFLVNPGATEICDNGIDDDCDGFTDEDCEE